MLMVSAIISGTIKNKLLKIGKPQYPSSLKNVFEKHELGISLSNYDWNYELSWYKPRGQQRQAAKTRAKEKFQQLQKLQLLNSRSTMNLIMN